MFHGKAKCLVSLNGHTQYFTRKDRKDPRWKWRHSCNPGKQNKVLYHRQMRRGKYKMMSFRGSEWKKLHCCDLWNWC